MKVLLTGANGLLGHNVLKRLLEQGHEVHAIVRRASSLLITHERLSVTEGSFLFAPVLMQAAAGCDAIINCAGVTDMSYTNIDTYLSVNKNGVDVLMDVADKLDIKTFVHVSTANTIGYGTPRHTADESYRIQKPFSESLYACSKKKGEEVLEWHCALHPDRHYIVVNPGFMVGPYDTKPSSGRLLQAAWRKPVMFVPKGGKSFVHVADVAAAVVNALTMGRHGQRYLLTGENMSIKEFYALQKKVCGYFQLAIPLSRLLAMAAGRFGDLLREIGVQTSLSSNNVAQLYVKEYYCNDKAVKELDMPQTPVAQAISDYFDWRGKNRRRVIG